MNKNIELLNIDCMEYMAGLEDNAFELAIVDPPYGIGADTHEGKKENGWVQYHSGGWDKSAPTVDYFNEIHRVSKNQIIWGANHFISKNPHDSAGWIVWNKMQRDFSLADGELAWTSFNKALRIFDMSRGEALANNKVRFHPTQKPVKLYDWLLKNYAKEGDRILDTHLGSGSSAIAAHYGGFDFVGCELDEDYYKAACERFERETAQQSMF